MSIPYAIEINPPIGAFTWEGWFNSASLANPALNGNDYRTVFCSMSNPMAQAILDGWYIKPAITIGLGGHAMVFITSLTHR